MSERVGLGGLFRKAPETQDEEERAAQAAAQGPAPETAADLDALFREALASGEVIGDVVAVDEKGREVKGRKRSNIFGA